MTKYLIYTAATSVLILSGCGGHNSSAKVLVPKIESYKAALGTMVGCGKQIEGAKELIFEAEGSYKSRAFQKYIESAMKEIGRAEKTCDKYERFKGEASTPQENLEKMYMEKRLTLYLENQVHSQSERIQKYRIRTQNCCYLTSMGL